MSATPKRGIKRKRGPEEPPIDSSKLFKKPAITDEEKFSRKLHHGVREIKKAAKIAKTRELQRLLKRLKELRAKKDQVQDISTIEEQLDLLKSLDHETISSKILLRRLQKDKHIQAHIQSNERVKKAISDELGPTSPPQVDTKDAISALLESRISSSKVLASSVGDLVTALRVLVLPRKEPDPEPIRQVVESELIPEEQDDGWESGSIAGDDRMLSENAGDSDENGATDDEIPVLLSRDMRSDTTPSEAATNSDEADTLPRHIPPTSTEVSTSSRKLASAQAAETENYVFLPTLAVGYTRGDSSASDWSGDEGRGDGKIDPNPRKNRRGQRARKAIWEKKYGRNANHLKKEREEEAIERRKRAEKRKNSSAPRYGKAGRGAPSQAELDNRSTDSGWAKKNVGGPGATAEVPLHPSWNAARIRKAMPMVVPSTGKKIVF